MKITGLSGETVDADAIKVFRYIGSGSGTPVYFVRSGEKWIPILKKQNLGIKLPTTKDFEWHQKVVDVRGARRVYELTSNEILLPTDPPAEREHPKP